MIVCMDFILFLSCMVVLSFYVNLINLLSFFNNLLITDYSVGDWEWLCLEKSEGWLKDKRHKKILS